MTTTYRKKLIEVALPLEAINKEAAREKSIRHGHPSTLHLWWARRPLAACRAVLFASLVDDPSAWPERFPTEEAQGTERQRIFAIIEELVKWENSNNERVLNAAKAEIARSLAWARGEKAPSRPDQVQAYLTKHAPPIYDPFCGGGSIPLEAQRLGLEAHASDLNPVAVLITKALIELPSRFAGRAPVNPESRKKLSSTGSWRGAAGLAADLRYYGQVLRDKAQKRVGELYPEVRLPKPQGGGEATPIAYLWARTVECPNPACRGRMPLIRSFWLSKKKGNEVFADPIIDSAQRSVRFEMRRAGHPTAETTSRTGSRCLFCERGLTKGELREQASLFGVSEIPFALVCEGPKGRVYLPFSAPASPPNQGPPTDYLRVPITNDRRWFSPPLYGLSEFRELFTGRQLQSLDTFCSLVEEIRGGIIDDVQREPEESNDATAYADTLTVFLALGINKAVTRNCTLAIWEPGMGRLAGAFGRQAMAMTWLFAETNPFAGAGGDIAGTIVSVAEVLEKLPDGPRGTVFQQNATSTTAPHAVISTDPPYYDNIGYADLSDFFYIWLRNTVGSYFPNLFGTVLVPKREELIASPVRFDGDRAKADKFFEKGLREAFSSLRSLHYPGFPLTLFYAFRQSESGETDDEQTSQVVSTGWETMLEGLLQGGFSILGTWPMRTELIGSLKRDISALASSIVLVCQPRPTTAGIASRRELLTALKGDLPAALRNLQKGNIAPVDLAQAAIGPGMAVFSRYEKVLETDGSPMGVRTALALINQSLDEVLAEQEGEFDGDTRWAVAWFDQHGFSDGPFGSAEVLCTAKNTSVSGMTEAGIVAARAGKVRLLRKEELQANWDPATDRRFTIWEATHHLVRALEERGEQGAADLIARLGGERAERARDLSYRLYTICERRKWAKDALPYNALVQAWPEASRLAAQAAIPGRSEQQTLI